MIDPLASTGFARFASRLLSRDETSRERLAPFAGRVARFEIGPVAATVVVTSDGRLQAAGDDTPTPDVRVSVPAASVPGFLADPRAGMRQVRLEGDAEFAQVLSTVLQALPLDPEEDLSPWVGDIAAVRIVGAARAALSAAASAGARLARSTADYFTTEQPLLASRADFGAWAAQVRGLEEALGALEARVSAVGAAQARARATPSG